MANEAKSAVEPGPDGKEGTTVDGSD